MTTLELIVWCTRLWTITGKDSARMILYISGILSLLTSIFIINTIYKNRLS